MKQSAQNGFAAVEAVLILVIVAIIAGTGYFVWHAKQNTDESLSNTSSSQPGIVKKSPSKSPTANTAQSTTKYLVIKEWGVEIPQPSDDVLSYTMQDSTDTGVVLISQNLKTKYGCDSYGAGLIARSSDGTVEFNGGQTYAEAVQSGNGAKVGNYYYVWGHDQAACSSTVSVDALKQVNDATKPLVAKLQAVQ